LAVVTRKKTTQASARIGSDGTCAPTMARAVLKRIRRECKRQLQVQNNLAKNQELSHGVIAQPQHAAKGGTGYVTQGHKQCNQRAPQTRDPCRTKGPLRQR
jgi:hypothetical protein